MYIIKVYNLIFWCTWPLHLIWQFSKMAGFKVTTLQGQLCPHSYKQATFPWTHVCLYTCLSYFRAYAWNGEAGCWEDASLALLDIARLLSKSNINLISHWHCMTAFIALYLCQHLVFSDILIFPNLKGVKWYLVLTCMSLIITELKHLFMCLSIILLSSYVNFLFISFVYPWIWNLPAFQFQVLQNNISYFSQ